MPAPIDPSTTAERIWREIGYRPDIPRDLIQPVMETFDLAVILLPRLSINAVAQWLTDHGRAPIRYAANRPLSGCLLAQRGHGLAFIDGSLHANERRFAVAHEFAHFYAHYLAPRRRALVRFGKTILPVLDGDRPPTITERLSEILGHTPLGTYEDYLGRNPDGTPAIDTLAIETEADLIALELLAPSAEASARLGPHPDPVEIEHQFGVPSPPATLWARYLAERQPRHDPFILSIERAIKKNA
jgi:hypothetical protein